MFHLQSNFWAKVKFEGISVGRIMPVKEALKFNLKSILAIP